MKKFYSLILAFSFMVIANFYAAESMKISAYPNTVTLGSNNLFIIAIPGVTNKNISWGQLTNLLNQLHVGGLWTNDPNNTLRPAKVVGVIEYGSDKSTNGPSSLQFDIINFDSLSFIDYAEINASTSLDSVSNAFPQLNIFANDANGNVTLALSASTLGASPPIQLTTNGLVGFQLGNDGNFDFIRKIIYLWPLTNALDGQVLAIAQPSKQLYWVGANQLPGGPFVKMSAGTGTNITINSSIRMPGIQTTTNLWGIAAGTITGASVEDVFYIGWNLFGIETNDVITRLGFENNWVPPATTSHTTEFYLQNAHPDGRVYRPFFISQGRNGVSNSIIHFRGEVSFLHDGIDTDGATPNVYINTNIQMMVGGGNAGLQVAPLEAFRSASNVSAIMIGGSTSSDFSSDASLGFYGVNGANRPEYARVGMDTRAAGAGAESGDLTFHVISNGVFAEQARLTAAGQLAIGTNSITSGNTLKLEVVGGSVRTHNAFGFNSGNNDQSRFYFDGGDTYLDMTTGNCYLYSRPASKNIFFYTHAILAMTVDSSQNIAIGSQTTAAAKLDVQGDIRASTTIAATNGFVSMKNNKAAPTSISVTASVFNYTNTQAVNIQVFLDANGATTAVTFNGTAIFSSLVAGDHTIIMQPGDRIGVTYSIATPIMSYREF